VSLASQSFTPALTAPGGPAICWPWVGASRHRFGYGFMRWDGFNTVPAHRIAYAIEHGLNLSDMPSDMVIRHICSDPSYRNNCNNPAHLVACTQAENIAEKSRHGTQVRGGNHHLGARYPDELIKTPRERYWRPEGRQPTITELGQKYGITVAVVSRWLNGQGLSRRGRPYFTRMSDNCRPAGPMHERLSDKVSE
jgi:hypothetical protein